MKSMYAEGIEYGYLKSKGPEGPFEEVIDYLLKVPCVNRPDVLDYIFRLYRYKDHLYITDMFPKMFEDSPDCFKRFTSHEGFSVNMRRLSVCCLRIFAKHLMSENKDKVMVISGSYAPQEKEQGASRKLRLYWHFFEPLLEELELKAVMMPEWNAFLLMSKHSDIPDTIMESQYIEFKTRS